MNSRVPWKGSQLLAALALLALTALPMSAQERRPATVVSVTDGDTIVVELPDGTRERTRLIGIDTPETRHPSRPVGCYGPEASAFTKGLVEGKAVELELDVQERDRYGRLLAYAWLGETNVNVEIAVQGYAQQLTIPPNVKYEQNIRDAVRIARENGRGLWSACSEPGSDADYEPTTEDTPTDLGPPIEAPTATPTSEPLAPPIAAPTATATTVPLAPPIAPPTATPTRAPAPPAPKPSGNCHPSYPDFCIPPAPPDLNCNSPAIAGRKNFTVRQPDPHRFDADRDGVGCESSR